MSYLFSLPLSLHSLFQMEKTWIFPKHSFVKINTHAIHYPNQLPNGNNSGLGVVIRDHRGSIVLMISGSIRGITARANELWAMLVGLRCAFYEEENKVQIESDNEAAVKEWVDWRWFMDPNHSGVIKQLLQRSSDPNLTLEPVKIISASQNRLARYLAVEGAHNRDRMVVFRRAFGRVREIWRLDMGLGPVEAPYVTVDEEEYLANLQDEEEIEGLGDFLVEDAASASMGQVDGDPGAQGVAAANGGENGWGH